MPDITTDIRNGDLGAMLLTPSPFFQDAGAIDALPWVNHITGEHGRFYTGLFPTKTWGNYLYHDDTNPLRCIKLGNPHLFGANRIIVNLPAAPALASAPVPITLITVGRLNGCTVACLYLTGHRIKLIHIGLDMGIEPPYSAAQKMRHHMWRITADGVGEERTMEEYCHMILNDDEVLGGCLVHPFAYEGLSYMHNGKILDIVRYDPSEPVKDAGTCHCLVYQEGPDMVAKIGGAVCRYFPLVDTYFTTYMSIRAYP